MKIIDYNENKNPALSKPQARRPAPLPPQAANSNVNIDNSKKPKRVLRKVLGLIVITILILGASVLWKAGAIGSKIFGSKISFFWQAANLVTGNQAAAKLQGEDEGQINILLLGYGGAGHDGPYLTDSMILASIRPADKKVLLTSIPRDYYYPTDQGDKINAVFPEGMAGVMDIEKGGAASEAAVGKIAGLTIPYFGSIDFEGFIQAIDRVGGIQVDVPNSFTDDQYPDGNANDNGPVCVAPPGSTDSKCRYLEVQFNAGMQTMDGQTALEYTRSRHASGVEGSDFARSRRQQLVIEAFKSKVEQLNLLTNVSAINDLLNILADHLHTDMTLSQAEHLAQIIHQPGTQIISQSLDLSSGIVCNGVLPTDGADVVEPCLGVTGGQIAGFFADGFEYAPFRLEQASVIMENDSTSTVEYNLIKQKLIAAGATVYDVAYRGASPLSQSVIYTVHSKPNTTAYLEQQLGVTAQPLPVTMSAQVDLVIIIADGSKVQNSIPTSQ